MKYFICFFFLKWLIQFTLKTKELYSQIYLPITFVQHETILYIFYWLKGEVIQAVTRMER